MMLSILMNVGTLLTAVAALLSMIAILKNRNKLKGFSVWATILRLIAISCFTGGQIILKVWLSAILDVLLIVYNLVVLYYVWRCRRPDENDPENWMDPRLAIP